MTGPMPVYGMMEKTIFGQPDNRVRTRTIRIVVYPKVALSRSARGILPTAQFSPIRTVTVGSGLSPDLLDPAGVQQALAGWSVKRTYRR